MAPPFIKVPTDPSASDFLSGPFRHFISPAQFSAWQRNNPLDRSRLRPSPFASAAALASSAPNGATATAAGNATGNRKDRVGNYEPPKHPAAEVLANIPSRRTSSRCNIVDWMLWLAANERRQAGRVSVGMRRRAEARGGKRKQPAEGEVVTDDEDQEEGEDVRARKEVVQRVAKARQLSVQARVMLEATPVRSPHHHRPHPEQPPLQKKPWSPVLEKRRLYEDAVSSLVKLPYSPTSTSDRPTATTGGLPPELSRLAPLARSSTVQTSPALLGSGSVDAAAAAPSRGQSLLQTKLAAEEAARAASGSSPPPRGSPDTNADHQHAPPPTTTSGATPHADYRIIYSDQRRRRAEEIFRAGVNVTDWCVGHRVRRCPDCSRPSASREEGSKKVTAVMGKEEEEQRPLASGISAMVLLTADVLRRYERQVSGLEEEEGPDALQAATRHRPDTAWFSVMTGLIVQSLLDGYLVHGWKGAACVDLISGIGSAGAVKAWKNWTPATSFATATNARRKEQPVERVGDGGRGEEEKEEGEGEVEQDEEGERQRRREEEEEEIEREKRLVEAAALVLGAAGAEKGDFERTLRDVAQEFFDVPEGSSLADHLDRLNAKYPRSESDERVLDWLEAVDLSLGKPELAKYEERAAAALDGPASTPSSLASATLQLHAASTAVLERYFGPIDEWDEGGEASVGRKRTRTVSNAVEAGSGDGIGGGAEKRARVGV